MRRAERKAFRLREMLSIRGMLVRAAVFALLFAAAHLAGWREHTGILCGTHPEATDAPWFAGYLGAAYVVMYLLATVASPILALAAGIHAAWSRIGRNGGISQSVRLGNPRQLRPQPPPSRRPWETSDVPASRCRMGGNPDGCCR